MIKVDVSVCKAHLQPFTDNHKITKPMGFSCTALFLLFSLSALSYPAVHFHTMPTQSTHTIVDDKCNGNMTWLIKSVEIKIGGAKDHVENKFSEV